MAPGTRSWPTSRCTTTERRCSGPCTSTPPASALTSTPPVRGKGGRPGRRLGTWRGIWRGIGGGRRAPRGGPRPVPRRADDQAAPGRRRARPAADHPADRGPGRRQPAAAAAARRAVLAHRSPRPAAHPPGPGGGRSGLQPSVHPRRAAPPRHCAHDSGEERSAGMARPARLTAGDHRPSTASSTGSATSSNAASTGSSRTGPWPPATPNAPASTAPLS